LGRERGLLFWLAILRLWNEEVIKEFYAREQCCGSFGFVDGEIRKVKNITDELGCDGVDEGTSC
jgi:hypothetical protein